MPYLIYKITNTVNGMLYIGATSRTLKDRWSMHRTSAFGKRKSASHSPVPVISPLHTAMRQYGADKFTIELLEEVLEEDAYPDRESYWIRILGSLHPQGYNKQCVLTRVEAAIIKYNAWGWTQKQYADFFGRHPSEINTIQTGFNYRRAKRKHLPPGIEKRAPL